MKRILLLLLLAAFAAAPLESPAQTWLERVGRNAAKRAEDRAKKKVEDKVDRTVDKAVDEAFEAPGKAIKGSEAPQHQPQPAAAPAAPEAPPARSAPAAPAAPAAPDIPGEMTPRAAMAECPMLDPAHFYRLVSPPESPYYTELGIEQYDVGLPPWFTERNRALGDAVARWMQGQLPESEEIDYPAEVEKLQREAQRTAEQAADIDPQQAMIRLYGYMQAIKQHYKLTDDEFLKLQSMTDEQAEAFLTKRCRELGIQPLDPAKFGLEYDPEEQAEQNRRQEHAEQIEAGEQTIDAYQAQYRQAMKSIDSLEQTAKAALAAADAKYTRLHELNRKMAEIKDITVVGTAESEENRRIQRESVQEGRKWGLEMYTLWSRHYIAPARGILQELLPYAEKADEAKAAIARMRLTETEDPLTRMALRQQYVPAYAYTVWGRFLEVTQSLKYR